MPALRLECDVSYAARKPWVPSVRQLAKWTGATLSSATLAVAPAALARGRRAVALSIRVVGSARSRSLNLQYRHKNRPTNVLSFDGAGAAPDGRYFLGDLVICAPVVAREALIQGKTLESHWAHMTVHGVLHLLGLDHESHGEAAKMEAKEVQILDRLGFSDPYR
ncbi:MAG: rRNA maturation RNase YbeY [Gammaproteobacteria bacterium]